MIEKYIGSVEVGKILGVSRMTINRWARNKKIPSIRANIQGERVRYFFIESEIRELII